MYSCGWIPYWWGQALGHLSHNDKRTRTAHVTAHLHVICKTKEDTQYEIMWNSTHRLCVVSLYLDFDQQLCRFITFITGPIWLSLGVIILDLDPPQGVLTITSTLPAYPHRLPGLICIVELYVYIWVLIFLMETTESLYRSGMSLHRSLHT